MEVIDLDGNDDDDEFECSECDFRCLSESEMIQHRHSGTHKYLGDTKECSSESEKIQNRHSGKHQYQGNTIDYGSKCHSESEKIQHRHSVTHQYQEDTKDYGARVLKSLLQDNDRHNENITEICSKESINKKEFMACITSTNNSPSNSKPILKRESSSHRDNSIAEDNCQSKIWNKNITLEDIGIDHNITPHFSVNHMNAYYNIQQVPSSLALILPKTENIVGVSEEKDSHYNNADIYTEGGVLSAKIIALNTSGSLSCQMVTSWSDSSFTKASQDSKQCPTEIEVDNTGIYIPTGWKRKVFMRSKLFRGKNLQYRRKVHDCYYYTELGKRIRGKKEAYDHIVRYPLANVDIKKLDFSIVPIKERRLPQKSNRQISNFTMDTQDLQTLLTT